MSEAEIHNPFAPPQATVGDVPAGSGALVLARRSSRLWAVIVDALIGFVLGMIVGALSGGMAAAFVRPGHLGFALVVQGVVAIVMFAVQGWMLYHYGQTIGKRVLGVRIVRRDGSRASLARVLVLRMIVPAVVMMIPFIGVLLFLADALFIFGDPRRCLHDWLADTIVVTAESSEHATLAATRAGAPTPAIAA